jgi:hypothetical protein
MLTPAFRKNLIEKKRVDPNKIPIPNGLILGFQKNC